MLCSRDRSGAYLISLCMGTALFGMFFFLTLFVQEVWGYSALKPSAAYLPFVPALLATTAVAQLGVNRIGARPLLIVGSTVAAGGMFWLSRITEHSTYAGGMLGPELLLGAGLGPLFVVINLVGLHKVHADDTGVASSLVNVGQEVGGSVGLAVLGTVAWTAVASNLRSQIPTAAHAGLHPTGPRAVQLHTRAYHHALATGFSRGYLVSAGILALILVIAVFMIRFRRAAADPDDVVRDVPFPGRPLPDDVSRDALPNAGQHIGHEQLRVAEFGGPYRRRTQLLRLFSRAHRWRGRETVGRTSWDASQVPSEGRVRGGIPH